MFCTKCGNTLADDAKFCTKCGTPVKAKEEKKAEEVKTEEPKVEEKKEEVKTEEPKVEEKKEEVKTEEPKVEEKKEEVKTEEPKVEEKKKEVKTEEPTPLVTPNVENPALKKANSSKLPVIIGVVAGGVVILGIVIAILWATVFSGMFAMKNYKKALEENDYKTAKDLVKEKIKDSKYEDEATDLLAGEIDELKTRFAEEDMSLEDLEKEFESICKIKLDIDDEVEDFEKFVVKLQDSKNSYDEGKRYFESEDYSYAYGYLKNVIKEDGKNYKKAQSMMSECEEKIIDAALENAKYYAQNGYYASAQSALDSCKDIVGEKNKKLNDAYGQLEGIIVDGALANCESSIENGYYSSALSNLNDALTYYPENKDLQDKIKECANKYAEEMYASFMSNVQYYDDPEDLAEYIEDYLGYSDSEDYKNALKAKFAEFAKTYETAVIENLKAGDVYSAKKSIDMLGAIDAENAIYTKCKEAYDGKFEYAIIGDLETELSTGYAYTYGSWTDSKEVRYDNVVSMSTPWSESFCAFNISVADYKSISGRVAMSDTVGAKGKFIIAAANKTLLSVNVDNTTSNVAFNVAIPEGTTTVTFRYVEAADNTVSGTLYVGNLVFGKNYFDAANDATLKEIAGEATPEKEETTPEEGETEEAPSEDATTEETPSEDATTEETPSEDATTEEAPSEDATTEETPSEDATTEAPSEENAADTPVENEVVAE